MKRENGKLLQRHGDTGETRAHEHTDDGGGTWLRFVSWWLYDGKWTSTPADSLSFVGLEALRALLNERAATTVGAPADFDPFTSPVPEGDFDKPHGPFAGAAPAGGDAGPSPEDYAIADRLMPRVKAMMVEAAKPGRREIDDAELRTLLGYPTTGSISLALPAGAPPDDGERDVRLVVYYAPGPAPQCGTGGGTK